MEDQHAANGSNTSSRIFHAATAQVIDLYRIS